MNNCNISLARFESLLQKHQELARFLVVGSTTVLIDLGFYRLCLWSTELLSLSKAVGFLIGTVFAYFANRFWTFEAKEAKPGNVWLFILLYGATLIVNVAINSCGVWILGRGELGVNFAFLAATAVSASLNFLGMKFFVFRQ